MKKYVDFVDICPEVGIGLGTPRKPIRLVKIDGKKNLYQPSSDRNLTDEMHNFTKKFVASTEVLDGFIFKRDSPTCGITDVRLYHKLGTDSGYQKTSGLLPNETPAKKIPQTETIRHQSGCDRRGLRRPCYCLHRCRGQSQSHVD